ncbi:MAG: hypothetical protein Q8J78_02910 [Moraxellaceae bacterium]|nr:hypothetical protein [Moraxellaceae bacterium]
MSRLREEQIAAASAFAEAQLSDASAAAVIAGSARMAGTFLFRSFAHALNDVTPGTVLLSPVANAGGPDLIGLLSGALARLGIRIDAENVDLEANPTSLPTFLETQRQLEPACITIRERFGLSNEEAAHAAAVATAMLIKHMEKSLAPQTAFGIAVYGFIEGSKTAPDPVKR